MIYDAVNTNVKLAGQLIINKEIIIYPTDTLYGFGVDATSTKAITLLNKLKKRNSPLSIIVSSIKMLEKYAILDKTILSVIEKILPGSFTLLLKNDKNNNLSSRITLNTGKVGIRIPKSSFIIDVVNYIGRPIVTTSINKHNEKSINDINTIISKYNQFPIFKNDICIDSNGSTILDLTMNEIKLIRQGDGVLNNEYIF